MRRRDKYKEEDSMRLEVIIASPRDLVRRGLRVVFESHANVNSVHEIGSLEELMVYLQQEHPLDLLIVDQVLQTDLNLLPQGKFAIIAADPDIHLMHAAYLHGGCGYLTEQAPEELLHALVRSDEETFLLDPSLTPWVMNHLVEEPAPEPGDECLTTREREIAELMRQRVPRRVIAERLVIAETTLKTHIRNIVRKRREYQLLADQDDDGT